MPSKKRRNATDPTALNSSPSPPIATLLEAVRPAIAPPPDMLFQHFARSLARGLAGVDHTRSDDERRIDELRVKCRAGNPFPLIAAQWPELIVIDPAEAVYFDGEIGSADNPCLRLDNWQRNDIIKPFFDDAIAEIAVKGNTKAGKGCAVSISINLWFDVFDESKIILTSQRFEHAVDVIFGEVSMWRMRMQHPGPGKLLAQGIFDSKQHYLTIANPQSGEGFSGQHGPRTLFVMDEATSIRDSFHDDAQKQARKIVSSANPRTLFGWFRNLYKGCRGDQNITQTVNGPFGRIHCVTVDGATCCNVRNRRLEKPMAPVGGIDIDGVHYAQNDLIPPQHFNKVRALIPNQCDYARYRGILQHPDPRHVDVFARGRFPTEDAEKQVILAGWIPFHEAAWKAYPHGARVKCFGLDPAPFHDETILVAGGEEGVADITPYRAANATQQLGDAAAVANAERAHTMRIVDWVLAYVESRYSIRLCDGRVPICVDSDGVGKGVGDRLIDLGCWVIQFYGNAGSKADPRRYGNTRAEAYGELGRRLDPQGPWGAKPYALPPDVALHEDLTAPEKVFGNDPERFHLSPKRTPPGRENAIQSVHDKIGRSPDRGDGTVYMFHAVRELGLWSSWLSQNDNRQAAYIVTDKEFDESRKRIAEAVKKPDSVAGQSMSKETRELMAYLQQLASGRD